MCWWTRDSWSSLLFLLFNIAVSMLYSKYGDEQFPNIEPLRILYHPDQLNQPGHYDILVNQYSNIPHIRNGRYPFCQKRSRFIRNKIETSVSFCFLYIQSVRCYLKAKRNKNTKKHFIEAKNFTGFVSFYLPCVYCNISVLKHCKYIWNAINLRHSYKKHWPLCPFSLVLLGTFLGLKWKMLFLICGILLHGIKTAKSVLD